MYTVENWQDTEKQKEYKQSQYEAQKLTEEAIKEKGKKITGISKDPHQKKKVFKESRS